MAHTSRCENATGGLARCRCSCGGARHGTFGTTPGPASTNGGGGTIAAAAAGGPLATIEVHPSSPGRERLDQSIASGVASARPLGGMSGSGIELRTHHDGTRTVRKGVGRYQVDDFPPAHQLDAEVLGPLLVRACGLPAPETFLDTDGTHIVQEHLPGATAEEQWASFDRIAASDDGAALALADTIMANCDRNGGNYTVDGDRITGAFDHSSAFAWTGETARRPARYPTDFQRSLAGDGGWVESRLSPADIERVRARVRELRPAFAASTLKRNRLEWWQKAMARLDAVERHATGERDLIR
jgi:hypothetical protein